MRKLVSIIMLSILVAGVFVLPAAAADKVYKWDFQTYAMPTSDLFKTASMTFKELEKATDGRLVIKLHPGNGVVPDPQVYDATINGLLEGSIHTTSYLGGRDMGYTIQTQPSPMLFKEPWELAGWYYEGGGQDLINKHFEKIGLYHLALNVVSSECIVSNKPLASVDDFQGITIRSLPGPTTIFFEKLGASVLTVPGAELYTALDTGVVDAAEFVGPMEDYDAGLHEVTRYVQYPGIHLLAGSRDIVVSLKAWNSLPADLQESLRLAMRSYTAMDYFITEPHHKIALKKMKEEGLIIQRLNDEELAKATAIGMEVAEAMMEMSPMAKEVVQHQLDYMNSIKVE